MLILGSLSEMAVLGTYQGVQWTEELIYRFRSRNELGATDFAAHLGGAVW
jgi:hypothetical protein